MHGRLRMLLLWAGLALAAATASAGLAPFGWPFELFSHFRVQYVAAWGLLALALLLLRHRIAAGAAAVVALGLGGTLVATGHAALPVQSCRGPALTVATSNLHFRNSRPQAFLDWLARSRPDFIVLQEVTPAWRGILLGLDGYPHRAVQARPDAYGLATLSRRPLEGAESVALAGDGHPSFTASVSIDGRPLQLLALHARWPVTATLGALRDEALAQVAVRARASTVPFVALGDFNLSPWSPAYARLLEGSGLRDAASGRGWQPTWLAGFWPLALRIDHVLVSADVCVEALEVGPDIGSDHRPVLARLRLP